MTAALRLLVLALVLALSGCALVKHKAVGMVASTLASSGDVFTRDDDLELVGQAIPFGLKLYESLLDSAPEEQGPAPRDLQQLHAVRRRLPRDRGAGPRRGPAPRRSRAPQRARAEALPARPRLLPARRWKCASRASAPKLLTDSGAGARQGDEDATCRCSTGRRRRGDRRSRSASIRPDLVDRHADGPRAGGTRAGARRDVEQGRAARDVHLARQPAGGAGRHRRHARASTSSARWSCKKAARRARTSRSRSACRVPAQDRAEFESLLKQALAVDPEKDPSTRLVTLVQQRRARALLDHIDTLFTK